MQRASSAWKLIGIAMLAVSVLLGGLATYFYYRASLAENLYASTLATLDAISYEANIMIDFGNGTRIWHNATRIPIGWNLYNVTLHVTQGAVDATFYPQFGAHFVNAIHGVGLHKDPARSSWFWIAWVWDTDRREWRLLEVGADQMILGHKQTVAWYYEDTTTMKPPP